MVSEVLKTLRLSKEKANGIIIKKSLITITRQADILASFFYKSLKSKNIEYPMRTRQEEENKP